ncbi:uncharacterized protein PFL1_04503 [Pseudozyma flocculosa PF-1]|uniref:Amino acid transporter transmembrane domain-containing protein n=1 Tax=Pseudozyma flocculosa PF-1 TaxID=1277687 RepID=A0A061HC31_9BASI|nr:uncharacterized protein PFL1_04503 [Pseudozyma flocculosa PF-1]EPQ28176.1 hypothetical protein PFL1_04503 [Pseudozyma flocculosa PF-1]
MSDDYDDDDDDEFGDGEEEYDGRRRAGLGRDRADDDDDEWRGQPLPPNAVQRNTPRGRSRRSGPASAGGTTATTNDALRDPFADGADTTTPNDRAESTPLLDGRERRHRSSYLSTASASADASTAVDDHDPDFDLDDADGALLASALSAADPTPPTSGAPGSSTFLQSWFNTVNALVGVGILALPLAFSYAGWIGGAGLFLVCGALTNYTGKVLAAIMAREPSLRTYADIGSYAFGPRARWLVSLFFCLELWAVSVALIILFGDSMAAIVPALPSAAFKAVGLAIVLPTVFLPLRWLSPISVVGIVSTVTLVVVVVADGLYKRHSPGSILDPAPSTSLGPQWRRVPLSFGLIMSGFSSHPVIPSLVNDMRDPRQFPRMLNLAYLAATLLYLAMGMAGYAMFGRAVSDEITRDLAATPGFPVWLNRAAIWLIVVNPLAKFALASRPIQVTFETLLGLDGVPSPAAAAAAAGRRNRILQPLLRTLLTLLITATAIVLPGFEKVMAFLGAFLAFATCILGPLLANFALFGAELPRWRVVVDLVVLALSAVLAALGTVWAFLPM